MFRLLRLLPRLRPTDLGDGHVALLHEVVVREEVAHAERGKRVGRDDPAREQHGLRLGHEHRAAPAAELGRERARRRADEELA